MRAFLVRRVAFALVLVACASSAAFLLTRAAPGDVTTQLGPLAKAAEVAATRARFGLDQPVLEQWALWASRAVRLDFGDSFLYNRPVGERARAGRAQHRDPGRGGAVVATPAGSSSA